MPRGRVRARPQTLVATNDLVVERDPLRPSGRLLRQGDMEASYVDLADPRHLEFDYLRWIRIILQTAHARRVLHIGGAGCALARALADEDPCSRHEVCEIDGEVLELAREHMGLRRTRGLRVRHVDGRDFLSAAPAQQYDAVVIDAFVGAMVPRRLVTVEAFEQAANAAPLTLVNVVDGRAAREVRTIAAALRASYEHVWTLGVRPGNTVVAGASVALDLPRLAARAAADPAPPRLIGPTALEPLLAGLPPLRDGDAA